MMSTLLFKRWTSVALCALFAPCALAKSHQDLAVDEEGNVDAGAVGKAPVIASDWALEPLGAAGDLKWETAFRKQPKLGAPPKRPEGPVLVDESRVAVVVTESAERADVRLAREIARHLSDMSGRKVAVAKARPASGPFVLLRRLGGAPDERMTIRTEGAAVILEGEGAGLSHAATYFLESLGIRYLWPGELGKVIPKRARVVAPEMNVSYAPEMRVRGMRGGMRKPGAKKDLRKGEKSSRPAQVLKWLGIDPAAYTAAFNAAYAPRDGERDFYRWHGILDNDDSAVGNGGGPAKIKEGHYYKGYAERFGHDHPEYFALQRSGVRDPFKVGGEDRPVFCYSNPEFVKAVAADQLAHFRTDRARKTAWTVSPADGGVARPCMCEKCRRLDPVNAPAVRYTFPDPVSGKMTAVQYPSMSDRMIHYFNEVLKLVQAEMPERKLTFYSYSNYRSLPVKEMPMKGLIVFSVAGNRTSARLWNEARENVAGWLNAGLDVYWRPNIFNGWRPKGPVNFSRYVFGDLEIMKANGLKGTDFDTVSDSWGAKGLDFYMTARAHLNVDRLSYDALLDDYCASGFGPAARPVKDYFLAVERMCLDAGRRCAADTRPDLCMRKPYASSNYLASLDLDRLQKLLDGAKTLAAGERDVILRLRYLEIAVAFARWEKRLWAEYMATATGDLGGVGACFSKTPKMKELQRGYAEFIRDSVEEAPLAVTPGALHFYSAPMWKAKPIKPRAAKK